jgi:uncharacterized repeat protein (TIGR03803 family)
MRTIGTAHPRNAYFLLWHVATTTLLAITGAAMSMAQSTETSRQVDAGGDSSPPPRLKVLYSFKGGTDGFAPVSVIRDAAGSLYGTTTAGGDPTCDLGGGLGCGTVFRLAPTGEETVLHRFTGRQADQGNPFAGVILDTAGNLYGTSSGVPLYDGSVFKVNKFGKETVLYRFSGGTDGLEPLAGLVRDSAGNLYGTTSGGGIGGPSGQGVVFKVDTTGRETVLYRFTGGGDGASPMAGLVLDSTGNLYGTTRFGGAFGNGVVFKVDASGSEMVLHSFSGVDGATPVAPLVRDSAGNLYGTTVNGGDLDCNLNGSPGCGVVFRLDPDGEETVLYMFTGGADGGIPTAALVRDSAGNLYGCTGFGGDFSCQGSGCGVVFKLDTNGKETVLHTFTGGADGGAPDSLVTDAAGNLYGTAAIGGGCRDQGCGTVFKITP